MCILIDPTESRRGTRLPQSVIEQATVLPGLEALTGADILVAVSNVPDDVRDLATDKWTGSVNHLLWRGIGVRQIAKDVDKPLGFVMKVRKFRDVCQKGLLVQRKTSLDLSSSVPYLSDILFRMLQWTNKPWLLFVGDLKCDRHGRAIVDGRNSHFSHNAVQGALESFQLRGGMISFLSNDNLVMPWLSRWLDKLRTLDESKLVGREPVQAIVGPDSDRAWMSTLASIPDVGKGKARLLADQYSTLAACVEALTDPHFVLRDDKPKGIGEVSAVGARRWFGLKEGERMKVER